MSYCTCDYEPAEFYTRTWINRSKKPAKCCECGARIEPGSSYEYVAAKWDGYFGTFKTCERCADLRDSMVGESGCISHGELREEYRELLLGVMENYDAEYQQYDKVFGSKTK